MCLYSLHLDKSQLRKAEANDKLTLQMIQGGHRAFRDDKSGLVSCIRPGMTVALTITFDPTQIEAFKRHPTVAQPDGSKIDTKQLVALNGMKVKATFSRWTQGSRYSADAFQIGTIKVHMGWLALDTKAQVARKTRNDAGVPRPHRRKINLEKALGLDQLRAEVPVIETEKVSS